MEEQEEISDPRGESLPVEISDKMRTDDDSSSASDTELEAKETPQRLPPPPPPDSYPQPPFVKERINRAFVREKPAEDVFDDGEPGDLFLWKNKKTSALVLGVVTAIWVCFELLEYHLLTLICHITILALGLLFLWSNASTIINKKPPHIPEVRLPEDPFHVVASTLHNEINEAIAGLREIAAGRDLKRFLTVVGVMWVLSIIGSFWNFLTLFYFAFLFLYTVPVLYETYSEKIDAYAENAMTGIQKQYAVFGSKVLGGTPRVPSDKKKVE